jgi:hypothetical protein
MRLKALVVALVLPGGANVATQQPPVSLTDDEAIYEPPPLSLPGS